MRRILLNLSFICPTLYPVACSRYNHKTFAFCGSVMVMKNFLLGLSKLVLGIILAMLIMSLAGLSMARYFMTRMVEQPERPTYENDLPEADRPQASSANGESEGEASESASDASPARRPSSDSEYTAYATTDLNLRSGPGTSYGSIDGVSPDQKLTVIGEEGGWLNVVLSNGSEGWVSGNYVTQE